MKKRGIFKLFLIYLVISGCVKTGTIPLYEQQSDEEAEQFEPSLGLGNLYIVRDISLISAQVNASIKVNDQYVGSIAQSSYHRLELSPGKYLVSASVGEREAITTVRVTAGKNHYVQVEPGGYYWSKLLVEQIDAEEGREMVSVGYRLVTQPIEFKSELTQEEMLEMPAADLAQGYLAANSSLILVKRQIDAGAFGGSGARLILGIRGERVDKDNVNGYLAKYQKQLSLYKGVINQRGYVNIAGAYKGKATKSCANSNSLLAAGIQQEAQTGIEIRQEGVNAQIMVSLKLDDKEKNIGFIASIAETAISVIEASNSDYFFLGEIKDQVIVLRPDVSVINTWPKWSSPPRRSDLENCKVTLTRLK